MLAVLAPIGCLYNDNDSGDRRALCLYRQSIGATGATRESSTPTHPTGGPPEGEGTVALNKPPLPYPTILHFSPLAIFFSTLFDQTKTSPQFFFNYFRYDSTYVAFYSHAITFHDSILHR